MNEEKLEKQVEEALSVDVPVEVVKEVKKSRKELRAEELQKVISESDKVLDNWKKSVSPGNLIMDGAYAKINKYLRAVKSGYSTGLLILGEPGLGKSFTVEKSLKNLDQDFECVESYITPPELFIALYRCRNKVLWLDDCLGAIDNPRCLSYLKSALASTGELNSNRKITNATQKPLQDPISGAYIPNTFIFNGKIVICTNSLTETNKHVKAVLSRLDHVKLVLSDDQKFRIMEEIVNTPYSKLSRDERVYCLDYLKKNSSMCPRYLLNLRTQKKLYDYYLFCKLDGLFDEASFDIMARGLLELDNDGVEDSDIILVKKLEERGDLNREEKAEEFMSLTGKGRATYFRVYDRSGLNHKVGVRDE